MSNKTWTIASNTTSFMASFSLRIDIKAQLLITFKDTFHVLRNDSRFSYQRELAITVK
jgi:hypothetical protein